MEDQIKKACCRCKELLPLDMFYTNKNSSDPHGRNGYCKKCAREYYLERKEILRNNVSKQNVKGRDYPRGTTFHRKVRLLFTLSYSQFKGCIDCGETDPVVLEYDHVRDKTTCVSKMVRSSCTMRELKDEMDKCEVRCANCHRRKSAASLNYYSGIDLTTLPNFETLLEIELEPSPEDLAATRAAIIEEWSRRDEASPKTTKKYLAEKYGVGISTISNVLKGKMVGHAFRPLRPIEGLSSKSGQNTTPSESEMQGDHVKKTG